MSVSFLLSLSYLMSLMQTLIICPLPSQKAASYQIFYLHQNHFRLILLELLKRLPPYFKLKEAQALFTPFVSLKHAHTWPLSHRCSFLTSITLWLMVNGANFEDKDDIIKWTRKLCKISLSIDLSLMAMWYFSHNVFP